MCAQFGGACGEVSASRALGDTVTLDLADPAIPVSVPCDCFIPIGRCRADPDSPGRAEDKTWSSYLACYNIRAQLRHKKRCKTPANVDQLRVIKNSIFPLAAEKSAK
jgi:hypothetical protein